MDGRDYYNGHSFANGNSPLTPFSWRGGYEAPAPFRATWDGTFGDPLSKAV